MEPYIYLHTGISRRTNPYLMEPTNVYSKNDMFWQRNYVYSETIRSGKETMFTVKTIRSGKETMFTVK